MKCPFKVKICTKCKRILIAYSGNFKKCKNTKDGLYPSCKECDKLYRNKKENKEKAKQYSVEYREKNKEKLKDKQKQDCKILFYNYLTFFIFLSSS